MNTILEFKFNNDVVEFDLGGADLMINATEMGKIFGKEPYDFLKQEGTKRFIEVLKTTFTAFSSDSASVLNVGNAVLPDEFVFRTDRGKALDGGATWMHRQLALKFAAWLDPRFEVWIFQTIDHLLFDHAKRTTDELREKAKLTDRRDELVQELQSLPSFQEFMQVEYKIRQASNRIAKFNNNQLSMFRTVEG